MQRVTKTGREAQGPGAAEDVVRHKTKHLLRLVAGALNGQHLVKENADEVNGQRWVTGVGPLDVCLPGHGLAQDGLHEIEPLKPTDMPSLTGFTFALLSRLQSTKPIIWCVTQSQIGEYGQPYAFGFSRYGISPSQIIFVRVAKDRDLPFALEEAIKTDGIAAVIGEGARPCFTGSRRISLLCKTHKTPCLLMMPTYDDGNGSAALTRFQITPLPGMEDPRDPYGPGLPHWRVALPRVRGGQVRPRMNQDGPHTVNTPYPWRIIWDDQTLSFRPASVLRNSTAYEAGNVGANAHQALLGRRDTD